MRTTVNITKPGLRMEALINDHQSQDQDVLLIQRPSITTYQTRISPQRLMAIPIDCRDCCRSVLLSNQCLPESLNLLPSLIAFQGINI